MGTDARIVSVDDPALDFSVLSNWDDGSVAVAVVSGTADLSSASAREIRLALTKEKVSTPPASLTPRHIADAVRSIGLRIDSFRLNVANLLEPERIWWRNSQLICARYRATLTSQPAVQAVFDIQAYANGTALVEVVLENSGIVVSDPKSVATFTYSSAVVEVGGQSVSGSITTTASPEGNHAPYRAWYFAHKVGTNAEVRATQDHQDLQRHPLFFKLLPAAFNMAAYANDRYAPWSTGRQRGVGMGGTGDAPSIGYITQWDARFIQSGDHRAAAASETSALACLSFNVNYRDIASGLIPDFDSIGARDQQTANKFWPTYRNPDEKASWEIAHHPAAGLVAFVTRPSPVYIEIAQKISVWNGTGSGFGNDTPWTSGLHGRFYQLRGKAWALRSLAHAVFISPKEHPWRAPAVKAIERNVDHISRWMTDSKQKLNVIWDNMPGYDLFDTDGWPGFQTAMWQQHYLVPVLHATAGARLLPASSQMRLDALADWTANQAVRWVQEQPDGGWRFVGYHITIGTDPKTIASLDTWGEMLRWARGDRATSVKGYWMDPQHANTSFATSTALVNSRAGAYWQDIYWGALAVAVERGLPNAVTAFDTVRNNITDFSGWLSGFATDPRFGFQPRNI